MTTAPGGGSAGARERAGGERTLHAAPIVPCAAYTGALGARVPRDPGPGRSPGPGANSQQHHRRTRPGPRGSGRGDSEDPASAPRPTMLVSQHTRPLGPAGAAPRITCKEPERRPHLPPGRVNSGRSRRPPGAGQGEGPPAPRPRPLPRPPSCAARRPHRPQLPHACGRSLSHSRLGPPSPRGHWLLLWSLSRRSSFLFSSLAEAPVTSSQKALHGGERGAATEGVGGRAGSGVPGAEAGRCRGGKGRPQPGPWRRAAWAGPPPPVRGRGSLLPVGLALLSLWVELRGGTAESLQARELEENRQGSSWQGGVVPDLRVSTFCLTSSCLGGVVSNL